MAEAQVQDRMVFLDYRNLESILQCHVCCGRFREPTSLPCLHTYCGHPCLADMQGYGHTICPYCRRSFDYAQIKRNTLVESIVTLINKSAENLTECADCNRLVLRKYLCSHCGDNLCKQCCKEHFLQTKNSLESYINRFMREINMDNCVMIDEKTVHQGLLNRLGESLRCSLTSIQAYADMWEKVTKNIPEISLQELSDELKNVEEESLSLKRRLGIDVDTRQTDRKSDSGKAWDTVHVFYEIYHEKHTFLVILDPMSQWPELYPTKGTNPTTTVNLLGEVFCRMGVPNTVITMASKEFSSAIFTEFCRNNKIQHISRPTKNPFSNHFRNTFHQWVETVYQNNPSEEAIQNFLLDYRSSVCPDLSDECTPAEKLIGRKLRVNIKLRNFISPPPPPRPSHPPSGYGRISSPPPLIMGPGMGLWRRKKFERASMRALNQPNKWKMVEKKLRNKHAEAEDVSSQDTESLKGFDGSSLFYEDGTVISLNDIKPKFVASPISPEKKAPARS